MSVLQNPMHPGEVLKELYLVPMEMGSVELARHLGVPCTRIERLIKRTTRMSSDTALRLARVFNTTPEYWMNMQTSHDMAIATRQVNVSKIKPFATSEDQQ